MAPAYRLRAVDGSGAPTTIHYPDDGRPPVLTVVGAKELPRPALAFLGDPEPATVAPSGTGAPFRDGRPAGYDVPSTGPVDTRRYADDAPRHPATGHGSRTRWAGPGSGAGGATR